MKFKVFSQIVIFWSAVYCTFGSYEHDRYDYAVSINGEKDIDFSSTFNLTSRRKCSSLCLEKSCHGFAVHKKSEKNYLCHLGICPASLPQNVEWDVFKPTANGLDKAKGELVLLKTDNSVNFERTWADYKVGFGDPTSNYWIGLDMLHNLTTNNNYGIYITITDWENTTFWAYYCSFSVGPESDNYRLSVSGYDGRSTAGDSMTSTSVTNWNHNGMQFTTIDRDNDIHGNQNCASLCRGGWWFKKCGASKLTGISQSAINITGILWKTAPGYTDSYGFKQSSMKLILN